MTRQQRNRTVQYSWWLQCRWWPMFIEWRIYYVNYGGQIGFRTTRAGQVPLSHYIGKGQSKFILVSTFIRKLTCTINFNMMVTQKHSNRRKGHSVYCWVLPGITSCHLWLACRCSLWAADGGEHGGVVPQRRGRPPGGTRRIRHRGGSSFVWQCHPYHLYLRHCVWADWADGSCSALCGMHV